MRTPSAEFLLVEAKDSRPLSEFFYKPFSLVDSVLPLEMRAYPLRGLLL